MSRIQIITALAFLFFTTNTCLSQTVRGGLYFSPELNLPLQQPNNAFVAEVSPQIGFTTGGLVEFDIKENWKIRMGIGFTKSRYYTTHAGIFASDIDPTLGFRTRTNYVFNSIDVPALVVYRKPESMIGVFAGIDLTAFSSQEVEYEYTSGSRFENMSFVSVNPSVNLGLQYRFYVGSRPLAVMIEPYTRYYLRSTGLSLTNLLSTGLRVVFDRPF